VLRSAFACNNLFQIKFKENADLLVSPAEIDITGISGFKLSNGRQRVSVFWSQRITEF
jgi:hypothetical protein